MVVRLTPSSLDDGMPMNVWQRRRNLEAAGLTALADSDSGFAHSPLSDDMPGAEWQRARTLQVRGGDLISGAGGAGGDTLGARTQAPSRPTARPGQVGSARQAEFDGDIAAGQALGGLADGAQRVVGSLFGGGPHAAMSAGAAAPAPTATAASMVEAAKHIRAMENDVKPIADLIAGHEGGPGLKGYDQIYQRKGGSWYPPEAKKPTELTIDEWIALGPRLQKANGGSAMGKYQITNMTLAGKPGAPGLKAQMGLKGEELMSGALQDRMMRELLSQAHFDDYLAGRSDWNAAAVQERLAGRWDSWASDPSELTYPRAHAARRVAPVKTKEIQAALGAAKRLYDAKVQQMLEDGRLPPERGGWR